MKTNCLSLLRISSGMDTDLKFFFRNVFEKDVRMRCSAGECLTFSCFKKYDIPTTLPIQTFIKASFSEFRRIDTSCIEDGKLNKSHGKEFLLNSINFTPQILILQTFCLI